MCFVSCCLERKTIINSTESQTLCRILSNRYYWCSSVPALFVVKCVSFLVKIHHTMEQNTSSPPRLKRPSSSANKSPHKTTTCSPQQKKVCSDTVQRALDFHVPPEIANLEPQTVDQMLAGSGFSPFKSKYCDKSLSEGDYEMLQGLDLDDHSFSNIEEPSRTCSFIICNAPPTLEPEVCAVIGCEKNTSHMHGISFCRLKFDH